LGLHQFPSNNLWHVSTDSTGVVRILGIGEIRGANAPSVHAGVFGKGKRVSPRRGEIRCRGAGHPEHPLRRDEYAIRPGAYPLTQGSREMLIKRLQRGDTRTEGLEMLIETDDTLGGMVTWRHSVNVQWISRSNR